MWKDEGDFASVSGKEFQAEDRACGWVGRREVGQERCAREGLAFYANSRILKMLLSRTAAWSDLHFAKITPGLGGQRTG